MNQHIKIIREALEAALSDDQPYILQCKEALTALSELERMAVEPVAWTSQIEIDWAKRNPGRAGSFYAVKEGPSSLPLYAVAPPAQQTQHEAIERKDALLKQARLHVASNIAVNSGDSKAEDLYDLITKELQ